MGNKFKALQTLQFRGFLNVDDWYSITFTDYSIRLQAHFNSKMIRDYTATEGMTFTSDSNGHMCGEITIDDVLLSFTFTD